MKHSSLILAFAGFLAFNPEAKIGPGLPEKTIPSGHNTSCPGIDFPRLNSPDLHYVPAGSTRQANSTDTTDIQMIRKLISDANNGRMYPTTDNFIRVMPDLPYPFIGKNRTKEEMIINDSIRKERSNEKLIRNPLRIEISESKEMAYVYGSYTVDYDDPQQQHVHREGVFMLVWRKLNGQWMAELSFNRYNKNQE